jgi:hypothetical protein
MNHSRCSFHGKHPTHAIHNGCSTLYEFVALISPASKSSCFMGSICVTRDVELLCTPWIISISFNRCADSLLDWGKEGTKDCCPCFEPSKRSDPKLLAYRTIELRLVFAVKPYKRGRFTAMRAKPASRSIQ